MPPEKIPYLKPHLSTSKQIAKLEAKGIIFEDIEKSKHILSHINYYRLKFYIISPKYNSFDKDILRLYNFDKKLRNLVITAIESIEVSIKTQLCAILTRKYGSHPHLNRELFNIKYYDYAIKQLKQEYNRSNESFVYHFKEKYKEVLPPMWVVVEFMSLGQLSRWFKMIRKEADRKEIARVYNLSAPILESYLHGLTDIRNVSAHYSRLWNKKITTFVIVPKYNEILKHSINSDRYNINKVYNILVFIQYMLIQIEPQFNFKEKLDSLIREYQIETFRMGFPNNWHNLPVWSEKE